MAKMAKTSKRELRAFVERVNSDPLLRLRFLVDPIHTLDEAGIQLSKELKSALQEFVHEYVERFPNIALLPTGLSPESKKRGALAASAGALGAGRTGCDDEKILII
ncbi:MAG TPA: hypothetical protein VEI52_12435 [Terriglobales bacterium]|nr:hypothetical protein [Terriglobales bacterium]